MMNSDFIPRDAAIRATDGDITITGEDNMMAVADYIQGVVERLRAIPGRGWVPVTERMPEELAEVNIAWTNTDPEPYYSFMKGKVVTGSAVYCKGVWYWYSAVCRDYCAEYGRSPIDSMDDAIKVIAWMPLPEPPTMD